MVGETLPVAKIRKPPDVSEPDSKSKTGEEELDGVVPAASVLVHRGVLTEVVVRNLFQGVILGKACLCLQVIKSLCFIKCLQKSSFASQNFDVRISYESGNGFWIMDGREDGIYWKSSSLSFHDMVTPICWLVNHYIDWCSVYYWDLADQITKSNLV